ncbi:MAG: hypothetical protein EBR34_15270 [Sphingomonadaceae bacterium]|nr:hypothetical protein [Sphingomonadaceae bacterium]
MTGLDKAMRGLALALCVMVAAVVDAARDAWQAHLDALTALDMAEADAAFERSGAKQKAEALVLWEMQLEGRCAPSVPQAAAIPCPAKPRPVRRPAEYVWTVGPPLKVVR